MKKKKQSSQEQEQRHHTEGEKRSEGKPKHEDVV